MKYLIAIWALTTAGMVWASCTTHNYCDNRGRCTFCTTCCYGGSCTTTCS
jgi:hypothetical protein